MIRLRLEEVTPDMKLARPVYAADGRILLGGGTLLTESYLHRLENFDLRRVWVADPRLSDLEEPECLGGKVRPLLSERFIDLCAHLRTDWNYFRKFIIDTQFDRLIQNALEHRGDSIPVPEDGPKENPLVAHSFKVCLLATALGSYLGYPKDHLRNLAFGALFHDLGHVYYDGWEQELPGDLDEIHPNHTRVGFENVIRARHLSATIGAVCIQHHERMDGSGSPRKIPGEVIHVFSRLIAVADEYDTLTTGRRPLLPHEAMDRLRDEAGLTLDSAMVALFCARINPYPVGTPLQLSTGERAVVIENEPPSLERPTVRVLEDNGSSYDLELADEPGIKIESLSWRALVPA